MPELRDCSKPREEARVALIAKIESQKRLLADRTAFATIDPSYLIADAAFRLKWIDCAPEGAGHIVAPLCDKAGTPMGTCWNENVGPCAALRDARRARGLHPFSGWRRERFVTQFGVAERWVP